MANIQTNQQKVVDIKDLFLAARPVHWIKNLSIYAALFLTGQLYNKEMFINVTWGFVAFCLVSSSIYILNDIFDVQRDRLHPTKRLRPIAAGKIPIWVASTESIFLMISSFVVILKSPLSSLFYVFIGAYLLLQIFYSLVLKNIAILDIIIIATGFILRVYSGAFAIDAHLSVWFLLCVISVALFLASGKRRSELGTTGNDSSTRKSLRAYKSDTLNSYVTMFGNASWMSWALFTFFESPKATLPFWLVLAELSKTTTINKLLMLTIPVTIFGIMRYQALIFEDRSETPEKLLLTDKALVIAVLLWILIVYWIMYSGISVVGT